MSESNELHWLVNTEPLNFHFTVHFAAPKMPTVFSGWALNPIQNEKIETCPFNVSPRLLMDHLEGRRRAKVYCRVRGEKKTQHPPEYPSSTPWISRDKQGCRAPSAAGFPSACLLPTCSQAPLQVWDGISASSVLGGVSRRAGGGGGSARPGWHIQDEMSRCTEWEQKNKKKKRRKKEKAHARTHTNQ